MGVWVGGEGQVGGVKVGLGEGKGEWGWEWVGG
jgi:hypothetical protein